MQKITVLCIGKLKETFYIDAAKEYEKRLKKYCKLEILELPEQKLPESPSSAELQQALLKEAFAIEEKLPKNALIIAMCIEGELLSSQSLAQSMQHFAANGHSHLIFLIGGSYGLHSSIKEKAHCRLSMSPMTFPHHLARVMLLEQIYRAYQIENGSRYHK